MMSFEEIYTTAQDMTDDSTDNLTFLKRAINNGVHLINTSLKRYWTREEQTANLVASQQSYQLPEVALRIIAVKAKSGTVWYPVQEVRSEQQWNALNAVTTQTSTIPRFYHQKGDDVIELYPTPSSSVTTGLSVAYIPRTKNMSLADYTTGTITVSQGSATITHSATGFTTLMVGRYFRVDDGSFDIWYRVGAYVSTSSLTLENVYEGTGGSGKAFRIGEMPKIPDELHESLVDYACFRYWQKKRDSRLAGEYKALWDNSIEEAKDNYSSKSTSAVISPKSIMTSDSPLTRLPDSIT